MLREFGVKGVKIQEIFSLDEDMLELLPYIIQLPFIWAHSSNLAGRRPVYGLIFLFRWTEDDPEKQEASCPDQIWFANQVRSRLPPLNGSHLHWLTDEYR